MFHLQGNVYFERVRFSPEPGQGIVDGVRIVVRDGHSADGVAIKDETVTLSQFASVMATLCAFGENLATWQEACRFLERPYPGDDAAYERWQAEHPGQTNPLCNCSGGGDDPHKDRCAFWQFTLMLRRDWPGRNDYRPA